MLKYINDNYKLIVKLSKYIFEDLVEISYKDSKLEKALNKIDTKIIKSLINVDNSKNVIVKYIYNKKYNIFEHKHEPDILKLLKIAIKYNIDINIYKNNLLIMASCSGFHKIAELLLKNGADVHAENDWSLEIASQYFHFRTCELLLEKWCK